LEETFMRIYRIRQHVWQGLRLKGITCYNPWKFARQGNVSNVHCLIVQQTDFAAPTME